MTLGRLQIREGLFSSRSRRPINGARPSQHSIVGELVGAGTTGCYRELVKSLPFHVESVPRKHTLTILDCSRHDPLQYKLVGCLGRVNTKKPAVLDPVRVHAVDNIITTQLASIALDTWKIAARDDKSECYHDSKGSHLYKNRDMSSTRHRAVRR